MKKKFVILLSMVSIMLVITNSFYSYKIPMIQDKIRLIDNNNDKVLNISKTNHWIKTELIPKIETFNNFKTVEKEILNIETSMKKTFNTSIINIDKSKKGIIMISVNSKIYRDDIKSLLKLFKLQIPNGFVKINSIHTDSNYFLTNFDLIKFYKD